MRDGRALIGVFADSERDGGNRAELDAIRRFYGNYISHYQVLCDLRFKIGKFMASV